MGVIEGLTAEIAELKAPKGAQTYLAKTQAPLIYELFSQVIHGDFSGDNSKDLNLALRAREQLDSMCEALEKATQHKPIGSVTVSSWRGLENIEWQRQCDMPEGTHMLYLAAGAQPVHEGYQLVPVEPTEATIKAIENEWLHGSQVAMAKREYKAMLKATKE